MTGARGGRSSSTTARAGLERLRRHARLPARPAPDEDEGWVAVAGGNGDSPGQSPRGQTPAATPQKEGSSEWEELPSELPSER